MDNLDASVSALANVNDTHNLEQLPATKELHTHAVHELGNVLHDTLQVKDENLDCDINLDGSMGTSSRCLQKCATFPVAVGPEEKAPDIYSEKSSHTRSMSFPSPLKLVSAMKGSRASLGAPPRKLSVSWAPDVYDPLPTSLSHLPKKKSQQQLKSNKKHGKGKQKGKNVRGGGSVPKDKKHHHHRKIAGKSDCDRCLDSYANTDRVMSSNNYKSSVESLDFRSVDEGDDIRGCESNCGSSYLGKAGGSVHYAYAEAT